MRGDDGMIGAGDQWPVDDDGVRAADTRNVPVIDGKGYERRMTALQRSAHCPLWGSSPALGMQVYIGNIPVLMCKVEFLFRVWIDSSCRRVCGVGSRAGGSRNMRGGPDGASVIVPKLCLGSG